MTLPPLPPPDVLWPDRYHGDERAYSDDHWHDYKDRASPHRGDGRAEAASDEAEECAKAIRGDNARLSGAGTASA